MWPTGLGIRYLLRLVLLSLVCVSVFKDPSTERVRCISFAHAAFFNHEFLVIIFFHFAFYTPPPTAAFCQTTIDVKTLVYSFM